LCVTELPCRALCSLALCRACSCAQRAQPAPCRVPAELLRTAPCRGFLFLRLPWPPSPLVVAPLPRRVPLIPMAESLTRLLLNRAPALLAVELLRTRRPELAPDPCLPRSCAVALLLALRVWSSAPARSRFLGSPWSLRARFVQFVYCSPVRAARHPWPLSVVESLCTHQLPVSRSIRLNRSSPAVPACRCAAALVRISPKSLPWLSGV
jgi:hypothetical protein